MHATRPVILIIDEECPLVSTLRTALDGEGFASEHAQDARSGLDIAQRMTPDLVVLSQALPDAKGTDVCRELRRFEKTRSTPIIFLAANDSEVERVVAFELGTDDYVPKPFSMRELVLRIRAVLRRVASAAPRAPAPPEKEDRIRIDLEGHQAWLDGRELALTIRELQLLGALLQGRGRVLSRSHLLHEVWGTRTKATHRAVDAGVKRLREKFGDASNAIETVRGLGYRIRLPSSEG